MQQGRHLDSHKTNYRAMNVIEREWSDKRIYNTFIGSTNVNSR